MRLLAVQFAALAVLGLASCGGPDQDSNTNSGGSLPTGGASTGGVPTTGGASTGGFQPMGGAATGGDLGVGGAGTGGTAGTGGAGTGGAGTGGAGAVGTGGADTGGAGTGGLGTGGATGGVVGTGGGATGGAATGGTGAVATGGTGAVATGGTGGGTNPLADLVPSAEEVGLLLARRFDGQAIGFSSVSEVRSDNGRYKVACEWYGALGVAGLAGDQTLLDSLVTKFDPLKGDFVSAMTSGEAHVDRYVFGIVPLEIYLQTGDESYISLGTETADRQQTTNQTRGAIDDMFMMTGLQVQAYRATGDEGYLNYMSGVMVDYLGDQQGNGLFFHNVSEARTHWGRGNGWFAAGMAELMRDLPAGAANYQTIEDGYKKMMEGLVPLQGPNGLWYQVLDMPDDPNNWEETSCTGMFTYAMIAGVRSGVLDAGTYVPVIEAAWQGLQSKISAQGVVSDICTGTWYQSSPQAYMTIQRVSGDGHGQAPVLWAAAELLR